MIKRSKKIKIKKSISLLLSCMTLLSFLMFSIIPLKTISANEVTNRLTESSPTTLNSVIKIADDRGIDVTEQFIDSIQILDDSTIIQPRLMTLRKTWTAFKSQWATAYRPAWIDINASSGYFTNWTGRIYLVKVSEYSTINGPWVTLDYKGTVTCIAN